jgi:xylulokinase
VKYLLTFDIGTTSVKACIFTESLRMKGHASEEYQLITERAGWLELQGSDYWNAVRRGAKAAIANAGIDAKDIVTISVTTQGETLIPVDRNGKDLRNAIVWLDERAGEQAARLATRFDASCFYQETGLPELNGYIPVAKLLWIKENEPEIYEKTFKFLLLEDYVIMHLTGLFVTEKALSCSTGWYCFKEDGLWREMMDYAGLDAEKLPLMLECGTVVPASVLPGVLDEFGFSENVRVVTGAMDQTAGAVGAGNILPGIVTETTGTALCIGITLVQPDMSQLPRVTIYRHIWPGSYLMLPYCMTAGMFLKWFKDNFCAAEILRAAQENRSVYAVFDDIVSKTPAGSNGLIAIPYLTGTLQPHHNPNARGVFFGAGMDTKMPQFLRAIFESIAFMLRENIEMIENVYHIKVQEIRSLGGGAKSDVWRQIKADVSGIPIAVLDESECTSLGAAILAAVAAGLYPDIMTAAKAANQVADVRQPDLATSALYDKAYHKYCEIYERLEPMF